MSGVGGKGLIGPAILGGLGQGAAEGFKLAVQMKHYQAMEDMMKLRGLRAGVDSWWKAGGHQGPIGDEQDFGDTPSKTMGDEGVRQAASLRQTMGPEAGATPAKPPVTAMDLVPGE